MILVPHMNLLTFIIWIIGLGTIGTWAGKFVRWCYLHWKNKRKLNEMTAKEFEQKLGRRPTLDDLGRVNCDCAGETLHLSCGWCKEHDKPRYQCGCFAPRKPIGE